MLEFYREPNGDYLAVCGPWHHGQRDGRATAIAGQMGSVCTTGIGREFLAGCQRVQPGDVPPDWRRALDPDGTALAMGLPG